MTVARALNDIFSLTAPFTSEIALNVMYLLYSSSIPDNLYMYARVEASMEYSLVPGMYLSIDSDNTDIAVSISPFFALSVIT